MKLNLILSAILFTLMFSCTHKHTVKEKSLDQVLESYWEARSKINTIEATQQGDNRYNDILTNDQTPEFRRDIETFYRTWLSEVESFDRSKLDEREQLNYDLFVHETKTNIEGMKYPFWMTPFQQFWGLHQTMGQLGSGEQFQPFKTVQDYKNWLKRIDGFAAWSDSAIVNFREGIKAGQVLPKVLVKKLIPQLRDLAPKDLTKSIFYGPVKKFPDTFTADEKSELTKAYTEAIRRVVTPTYTKLADFMETEYLPKARNTHGIGALPGGKEMYAYLAGWWTTTTKTPEEIHALGLSEVARIRGEMEKVKDQVGFKGTLKQFFKYLNTDKKLTPYKSAEEILNVFRAIHAKIQPQLPLMFGTIPKTPFEIRQTEKFREASASAEYSSGSPDGKRPGIFYIPIVDAKKFNITSGMESLFLHEAIPGHHFQISIQQENTTLPKFRRFSWYGAYGEGWALYTESLGKELGLYTDPYQYMGSLGDEMHRAIRLVVDVAIHTKGMTREEAIKYMMENEQISEEGAIAEIERYMAIPGQALSYKVGALKIRELRTKYENQLGAKFKLGKFHDEVLAEGCLPLSVMEARLDGAIK